MAVAAPVFFIASRMLSFERFQLEARLFAGTTILDLGFKVVWVLEWGSSCEVSTCMAEILPSSNSSLQETVKLAIPR